MRILPSVRLFSRFICLLFQLRETLSPHTLWAKKGYTSAPPFMRTTFALPQFRQLFIMDFNLFWYYVNSHKLSTCKRSLHWGVRLLIGVENSALRLVGVWISRQVGLSCAFKLSSTSCECSCRYLCVVVEVLRLGVLDWGVAVVAYGRDGNSSFQRKGDPGLSELIPRQVLSWYDACQMMPSALPWSSKQCFLLLPSLFRLLVFTWANRCQQVIQTSTQLVWTWSDRVFRRVRHGVISAALMLDPSGWVPTSSWGISVGIPEDAWACRCSNNRSVSEKG